MMSVTKLSDIFVAKLSDVILTNVMLSDIMLNDIMFSAPL